MPPEVHVIEHPVVQHKLTLLRNKELSTHSFRNVVAEISLLLAYEVTRDLPVVDVEVETPLARARGVALEGKKLVLVPILRAGAGIVDGMLRILPSARPIPLSATRLAPSAIPRSSGATGPAAMPGPCAL